MTRPDTLAMPPSERTQDPVTIRMLREEDLPILQALSPPKNPAEFRAYVTLVAEVEGTVAGYAQFALTMDGTLHSFAIRVAAEWTGRRIGQRLHEEKVAIARAAGAKFHVYAVDAADRDALHAILRKQGMHRCHALDDVVIYAQSLTPPEPPA